MFASEQRLVPLSLLTWHCSMGLTSYSKRRPHDPEASPGRSSKVRARSDGDPIFWVAAVAPTLAPAQPDSGRRSPTHRKAVVLNDVGLRRSTSLGYSFVISRSRVQLPPPAPPNTPSFQPAERHAPLHG